MAMTDRRGTSLSRAIAGTIGALLVAILCTLSGIDRIAANGHAGIAPFFGGEAAGTYSAALGAAGDQAGAIAAAEKFVRTDPINPAATALLGATLLNDGQGAAAQNVFGVAGQLGWREVSVQLYWLAAALAANDIHVAEQRLDALMRLNVSNQQVTAALQQFESTPEGRQTLARLLGNNPPWSAKFFSDTGYMKPDEIASREQTIALARKQGAKLDCESISDAVSRLITRHYVRQARELWQSACGSGSSSILTNGDFEQSSNENDNPFTWDFPTEAGLESSIEPAPPALSGHALKIESALSVRKVGAYQVLYLAPGHYRVSWQSWSKDKQPDTSFTPQVVCNQSRRDMIGEQSPTQTGKLTSSWDFVVPQSDCSIQTFSIVKRAAGFGQNDTGWIDNIAITPAS